MSVDSTVYTMKSISVAILLTANTLCILKISGQYILLGSQSQYTLSILLGSNILTISSETKVLPLSCCRTRDFALFHVGV
jgi:hypothetical protein